jgi:hypothetical protein
MNFELSATQKRTILLSSKSNISNDLYATLIKIGIDPDVFDGSIELLDSDVSIDDVSLRTNKIQIIRLMQSLELINSKLETLDA